MAVIISRELLATFGTEAELAAAVADFELAIAAHAFTVDVAGPVSSPLVEEIVRRYDGEFTIEPEPEPEPEPIEVVSFRDIPRPSFLFMMSKMGITEAQVEGLIGQMPAGDARDLALIVFKNQQTFKHDNSLLQTLTKAAGLTSEQVDTAWRAAEQLTW